MELENSRPKAKGALASLARDGQSALPAPGHAWVTMPAPFHGHASCSTPGSRSPAGPNTLCCVWVLLGHPVPQVPAPPPISTWVFLTCVLSLPPRAEASSQTRLLFWGQAHGLWAGLAPRALVGVGALSSCWVHSWQDSLRTSPRSCSGHQVGGLPDVPLPSAPGRPVPCPQDQATFERRPAPRPCSVWAAGAPPPLPQPPALFPRPPGPARHSAPLAAGGTWPSPPRRWLLEEESPPLPSALPGGDVDPACRFSAAVRQGCDVGAPARGSPGCRATRQQKPRFELGCWSAPGWQCARGAPVMLRQALGSRHPGAHEGNDPARMPARRHRGPRVCFPPRLGFQPGVAWFCRLPLR